MTDSVDEDTSDSDCGNHGKSASAFTPEDLADWVAGLVSILESVNKSRGMFWCSQWWKHPEAVQRFRALYVTWLDAQKENVMSSWWLDHFDRHASVLFRQNGPFSECNTHHVERSKGRTLAAEQPPSGWSWDD